MSNYKDHAIREFQSAGWMDVDGKFIDEMQEMLCDGVLRLLDEFSLQSHSGFSASYTIKLFEKLAKFEPIVPLTGEDSEWVEVGEGVFQNNRCSRVFKSNDRFEGRPYDIEAVIFYECLTDDEGEQYKSHFTSFDSARPITFPYVPEHKYVEKGVQK